MPALEHRLLFCFCFFFSPSSGAKLTTLNKTPTTVLQPCCVVLGEIQRAALVSSPLPCLQPCFQGGCCSPQEQRLPGRLSLSFKGMGANSVSNIQRMGTTSTSAANSGKEALLDYDDRMMMIYIYTYTYFCQVVNCM